MIQGVVSHRKKNKLIITHNTNRWPSDTYLELKKNIPPELGYRLPYNFKTVDLLYNDKLFSLDEYIGREVIIKYKIKKYDFYSGDKHYLGYNLKIIDIKLV